MHMLLNIVRREQHGRGVVVCLCARSLSTIGFYPALVCTGVAWCLGGLASPTPARSPCSVLMLVFTGDDEATEKRKSKMLMLLVVTSCM